MSANKICKELAKKADKRIIKTKKVGKIWKRIPRNLRLFILEIACEVALE